MLNSKVRIISQTTQPALNLTKTKNISPIKIEPAAAPTIKCQDMVKSAKCYSTNW